MAVRPRRYRAGGRRRPILGSYGERETRIEMFDDSRREQYVTKNDKMQ
jgi:hypothetical protein